MLEFFLINSISINQSNKINSLHERPDVKKSVNSICWNLIWAYKSTKNNNNSEQVSCKIDLLVQQSGLG